MDRDFKIVNKGLKGKAEQPFITLTNIRGEKLVLMLESEAELCNYEIGDEHTVRIVQGAQTKLES